MLGFVYAVRMRSVAAFFVCSALFSALFFSSAFAQSTGGTAAAPSANMYRVFLNVPEQMAQALQQAIALGVLSRAIAPTPIGVGVAVTWALNIAQKCLQATVSGGGTFIVGSVKVVPSGFLRKVVNTLNSSVVASGAQTFCVAPLSGTLAFQVRGRQRASAQAAPLSEADVAPAMNFAADVLVGSLAGLTSYSVETASQVRQVASELVSANDATPVQAAKAILSLGLPVVLDGFAGNLFQDAGVAIPLMEANASLTVAAPYAPRGLLSTVVAPAYAAEPQQANWPDFQRNAADFLTILLNNEQLIHDSFNTSATLAAIPDIAPLMTRHLTDADAALRAAIAASYAQDGTAAGNALDTAGAIIHDMLVLGRMADNQFVISLTEFAGSGTYDALLNLLPRVQRYAAIVRLLPPMPQPAGAPLNIIGNPRDTINRTEQIGIEEMIKKIVELQPQLNEMNKKIKFREDQLNAQLKKYPDDEAVAKELAQLTAPRDELQRRIENIKMIQRAAQFTYSDVKQEALTCNNPDKCAMIRKIRAFNVQEVMRLLADFTDKFIKQAEEHAQAYAAKNHFQWTKDEFADAEQGGGSVFQPSEDTSRYKDKGYYRPKAGRLRYDPKNPTDIAEGIFAYAYGSAVFGSSQTYPPSARVHQIMLVGMYMFEDALEDWAADCNKPPSAIAAEVMEKFSAYIARTTILSKDGANDKLNEILAEELAKYKDGLAGLLKDLDTRYAAGLSNVVDNVADISSSWSATYPDVTALLNSIPPVLKALQALSDTLGLKLQVPAYVELAKAEANRGISTIGAPPPAGSTELTNDCPQKPQPPKQCGGGCTNFGLFSCRPDDLGNYGLYFKNPNYGAGPNQPEWEFANNQCGGDSCEYKCGSPSPKADGSPETSDPQKNTALWAHTAGYCGCDKPGGQQCTDTYFGPGAGGGTGAQCASAADLDKVKKLFKQCVSGNAGAKASLAEVWSEVKKYVKDLALESLQKQFDAFPNTIEAIVKAFLIGSVDDFEAKELEIIKNRDYGDAPNAGTLRYTARTDLLKQTKQLRAGIRAIRFTQNDFSRYWGADGKGPNILDIEQRNEVAKRVFSVIHGKLINDADILSTDYRDSLTFIEASGIGSALVAFTYDLARYFGEEWGDEKNTNASSLHAIILDAVNATSISAQGGDLVPGLNSVAAQIFSRKIRALFEPGGSVVPYVDKMYAMADAIDGLVKALEDFSKKDVEFQTAVTACVNTYGTGKDIADLMEALGTALDEAKKGTLAAAVRDLAKRVAEGTIAAENVANGGGSKKKTPEEKTPKEKTPLERSLEEILNATLKRVADEFAGGLKNQLQK